MDEEDSAAAVEEEEKKKQRSWRLMSPEIVEIGEESKSLTSGNKDVYVAVGKKDMDVVKWALDHAVSPGSRIFLVHVFPPLAYIPTPVGRLSRSQLTREQVQVYDNEENNKRRNLLHKYIRLCIDAKVAVDTMLLESNAAAKAILDLIPVVNITHLVIGTKKLHFSRRLRKGVGKGEFVQKNAPDFCEVTLVYEGKKVSSQHHHQQQVVAEVVSSLDTSSTHPRSKTNPYPGWNISCTCFSSLNFN